jgi:Protein of unknown function (DUF2442)
MIKVTKLRVLDDFQLELRFSDGNQGVLDCAPIIAEGGPMVEPLRDPAYFARVFLEYGAPTWPNGYDMAPWTLHKELDDAGKLTSTSAEAAE